jgi:hypothetical protein
MEDSQGGVTGIHPVAEQSVIYRIPDRPLDMSSGLMSFHPCPSPEALITEAAQAGPYETFPIE